MLKGKTAIVTGSTSGIGFGIARALAGDGCNLMLNGFGGAGEIESEREHIAKDFGVRVSFNPADLSKPTEFIRIIEAATRELGQVDILVNNAGIQHTTPVESFPADRWDAVMAINLSSNFHAIRAVIPQMRKRNWGRIINIASTHRLVASAEKAAYVAAKHGVLGLTKVVALETATIGITCNARITCNAICPGWVLTPLVDKQIRERSAREKNSVAQAKATTCCLKSNRPMNLPGPSRSVRWFVFPCSEAAWQIRGAALPVDGGWTVQ